MFSANSYESLHGIRVSHAGGIRCEWRGEAEPRHEARDDRNRCARNAAYRLFGGGRKAEQGNPPDRLAGLCRWMVRGHGVHRRVGRGALTRTTGRSPRPLVR